MAVHRREIKASRLARQAASGGVSIMAGGLGAGLAKHDLRRVTATIKETAVMGIVAMVGMWNEVVRNAFGGTGVSRRGGHCGIQTIDDYSSHAKESARFAERSWPFRGLIYHDDFPKFKFKANHPPILISHRFIIALVVLAATLAAPAANLGKTWGSPKVSTVVGSFRAIHGNGRLLVATGWTVDGSLGGMVSVSSDGRNWQKVHHQSTSGLVSVSSDGEKFVAVGYYGTILQSDNGWNWTQRESGTANNLNAVTWSGECYIAVGEGGTILRSLDGKDWQSSVSPSTNTLNDVVVNRAGLVIAGNSGTVLQAGLSGADWQAVTTGLTHHLTSCAPAPQGVVFGSTSAFIHWDGANQWSVSSYLTACAGGFLYAPIHRIRTDGNYWVATSATGEVAVSNDTQLWQIPEAQPFRTGNLPGTGGEAADTFHCGGQWYLAGSMGVVVNYTPGITWSKVATISSPDPGINGMIRSNGRLFAFGQYGVVISSTDGLAWSSVFGGGSNADFWYAAAEKDDRVLLVGSNGRFCKINPLNFSDISFKTLPGNTAFRGVAASTELYVAVGDGGRIVTSPDGVSWSDRQSGTLEQLTSVIHANGKFRATGANGTLLLSPDGITWQQLQLRPGKDFRSILATSNGYLVVARGGAIFRSADGQDWQDAVTDTDVDLFTAVEAGGTLYAMGAAESVLKSTDGGQSWQSLANHTPRSYAINASCYFDGRVLAFCGPRNDGGISGGRILFSTFPFDFQRTSHPLGHLNAITQRADGFVVVGDDGRILRSVDHVTWQPCSAPSSIRFNDVVTSGEVSVAVGGGGTDGLGCILSSTDGEAWQTRSPAGAGENLLAVRSLNSVAHDGHRFVCCGDMGAMFLSDDGVRWRVPTSSIGAVATNTLYQVVRGDQLFVVVGSFGKIATSPDGEIWTARVSPTSRDIISIIWTGTEYLATLLGRSQLISSPDGVTWSTSALPNSSYLTLVTANAQVFGVGTAEQIESLAGGTWVKHGAVASNTSNAAINQHTVRDLLWSGDHYVAVGTYGFIASSPDSYQWTYHHRNLVQDLNAAAFVQDRFVVVGKQSTILSSVDGLSWTKHYASTNAQHHLVGIASNGSTTMVVGSGVAFRSTDLWQWQPVGIPGTPVLTSITWMGGEFVAVGKNAVICRSPDGLTWTSGPLPTATGTLQGIATNGTVEVAAGDGGIHTYSAGAWLKISSPASTQDRTSVSWTGSNFIVTASNSLFYSQDGSNWSYHQRQPFAQNSLTRAGDNFFSIRFNGPLQTEVISSASGIDWISLGSPLPWNIRGLAWSGRELLAVGDSGSVYFSMETASLPFSNMLREIAPPGSDLTTTADPNHDGIPNVLAYFLGIPIFGNSTPNDRQRLPTFQRSAAGDGALTFAMISKPADFLELVIEESTDLKTWVEVSRRHFTGAWSNPQFITEHSEGTGRVEVNLTIPAQHLAGSSTRFWRLQAGQLSEP